MTSTVITIQNEEGIHARPAADFCETAMTFQSKITIRRQEEEQLFEAKSILSVLSLGAVKGDTIILSANGEDESDAIHALEGVLKQAV